MAFKTVIAPTKITTTYYYISGLHKVSWNIPEAYLRTMLVVLHNR